MKAGRRNEAAVAAVENLEVRRLMHGGRFRVQLSDPLAAIADFNGDKKVDVVSVVGVAITGRGGRTTTSSTVTLETGLGNGAFVPTSLQVANGIPAAVVAGDFNGDKNADAALLFADAAGNVSVQYAVGNGRGGLRLLPAVQSVGQVALTDVAAGDVNGDGVAEIVSVGTDGTVYELQNNGTGTLTQLLPPQVGKAAAYDSAGWGDVDGDGRVDLILTSADAVFWNKATASGPTGGTFNQLITTTLGSSLDLSGLNVTVGDVNGDGRADLIAMGDGSVFVALADPTTFSVYGAWKQQSFTGLAPARVAVGDVNGDGRVDLFQLRDNGFFGRARLLLVGQADGTFNQKLVFGGGRGGDRPWDN